MTGTLQDVHPDQLRFLRTAADLVLEEILRLNRKKNVQVNPLLLFQEGVF